MHVIPGTNAYRIWLAIRFTGTHWTPLDSLVSWNRVNRNAISPSTTRATYLREQLLGIGKPVIQGTMVWLTDGRLVAAVADAGPAGWVVVAKWMSSKACRHR